MATFGQTLSLWRDYRGITQAGLSKRTGISRPNLSRIESDRHDVTLHTIRLLAFALDVSPGALVNGELPYAIPQDLGRDALERIAEGANGKPLRDPREKEIAENLKIVIAPRLKALGKKLPGPMATGARANRAWLKLSQLPPAVRDNLVERSIEHAPDIIP